MTLRIHTAPAFSEEGTVLCPLLTPWAAEFRGTMLLADPHYIQNGVRYFARTGPEQCDLLVCPVLWQNDRDNDLVQRFIGAHRKWNRPIVVFCETDSEEPFPLADAIVFRGSIHRSKRLPREYALPAFILDIQKVYGLASEMNARDWRTVPVVGFCGQLDNWADSRLATQRILGRAIYRGVLSRPRLERWFRRVGVHITRSEGKRVRHQALGVVSRSPLLRANFIVRDRFMNGVLTLPEEKRHSHSDRAHREFYINILESDYVLCPRGGGNWSYRFYETLALGRVPVFINTDSVLPYEDLIPWRDHCVWVEGDKIETLPALVRDHYASHTEESFRALQQRCRELWLNFLCSDGFFRHFHQHEWRRSPKN